MDQPPWAAEVVHLVDGGHLARANRLIDTVAECGPDAATIQLARTARRLVEFLVADTTDPQSEAIRAAIRALLAFDQPDPDGARDGATGSRGCCRGPLDAQLSVRVLGPFEVRVHGVPVLRWASRRSRAALGVLVLHRHRPMLRDRLMDLLWPSTRPEAARNSLNVALHGLRRSLLAVDPAGAACDYVVYRQGCYQLSPGLSVWVDVDEFTQRHRDGIAARRSGDHTSAIAHLEGAVSLYRGALFENDTTADWHLEHQQRVQESYCDVLEELAQLRLEGGGNDDAAAVCHRILALDSCRESAHRLLMRAYARRGRRHEVLRQYADCAATLHRELGVGPDPATAALLQDLLSHPEARPTHRARQEINRRLSAGGDTR